MGYKPYQPTKKSNVPNQKPRKECCVMSTNSRVVLGIYKERQKSIEQQQSVSSHTY